MPKSDIIADPLQTNVHLSYGRGSALLQSAGTMKVWAELSVPESAAASAFITVEDILAESAENKPEAETAEEVGLMPHPFRHAP